MATTNLIVDFLVIGVSGFAWLYPITRIFLSSEDFSNYSSNINALPLVIGFVYIFGLAVSRLADSFTDKYNDAVRDRVFGVKPQLSYHNQLNSIILNAVSGYEYLSYRRSIIRVSRAAFINLGLGVPAWLLLLCRGGVDFSVGLIAVGLCVFMGIYLWITWQQTLIGYFRGIQDMHSQLAKTIKRKK